VFCDLRHVESPRSCKTRTVVARRASDSVRFPFVEASVPDCTIPFNLARYTSRSVHCRFSRTLDRP